MSRFNRDKWLISQLRRVSLRYKPRNEALKNARIKRGVYVCEHCCDEFGRSDIQLDHREPVVDIRRGFTDWDSYINSLFCESTGFQVLCRRCHTEKTQRENEERRTGVTLGTIGSLPVRKK